MERTLILVKPDAFERRLTGEVLARFERKGNVTLRARATDLAGRTQPEQAEWNKLGYGNNGIHEVTARIV